MSELELRIAKLESKVRRGRALLAAVLVVGCLPWMMASRVGILDEVRTKRLSIYDEKGLIRGQWDAFNDEQSNWSQLELIGDPTQEPGKEVHISLMASPEQCFVATQAGESTMARLVSRSGTGSLVGATNGKVKAEWEGKTAWLPTN